jgi:hypothetical protein
MPLLFGMSSLVLFATWFAVFGAGQAIDHREATNDAADSGAYAAGVSQARAMNLTALMNMVKLGTVAVASAQLCIIDGAEAAIRWVMSSKHRRKKYGWTVPILTSIAQRAQTTHGANAGTYRALVRGSDQAQRTMKVHNAEVVEEHVDALATAYPGLRAGVMAPWQHLPLERDPVDRFCNRVFPYQERQIKAAFRSVGAARVRDVAEGAAIGATGRHCQAQGTTSYRLGARPGSDRYQVNVYVLAEPLSDRPDHLVAVLGTWGQGNGSSAATTQRDALSQVGLAQAEFYFAGRAGPEEMLWQMKWLGRLVAVRGASIGAFTAACARAGGGNCGEIAAALRPVLQHLSR